MLQVVGEAGPEQFGLHFHQASHVKLPEPQLAFDPCVTKFRYSAATAVLGLGLVGGHLFPEAYHRRIFYPPDQSAALALIFRTALGLAEARLTVIEVRLVKIRH
jgi:hypothetical protein